MYFPNLWSPSTLGPAHTPEIDATIHHEYQIQCFEDGGEFSHSAAHQEPASPKLEVQEFLSTN